MAEKEYSTIQQHQPLRVPASFDKQGRALIVQLDEIFDDIYRRYGRLRFEDMGKDFRQRIENDEGDFADIAVDVGNIIFEIGNIDGVMTSLGMSQEGIDMLGKYIKIKSGALFEVDSDGEFRVSSDNLDISGTGLEVKKGLLKGDHYTPDGEALLSKKDIVVSTEEPVAEDGRIWIKPLDATAVNYLLNVPAATAIDGFSGNLSTSGAVSGLTGTFTYRLKFLVKADTTSGSGIGVTATIGGLTFTASIAPGSYPSGGGYDGDRVFDVTVTSNTWLGDQSTLALSVSASGGTQDMYKIKAGSIQFTASGTGTGGAGWKNCEIKVYKG